MEYTTVYCSTVPGKGTVFDRDSATAGNIKHTALLASVVQECHIFDRQTRSRFKMHRSEVAFGISVLDRHVFNGHINTARVDLEDPGTRSLNSAVFVVYSTAGDHRGTFTVPADGHTVRDLNIHRRNGCAVQRRVKNDLIRPGMTVRLRHCPGE